MMDAKTSYAILASVLVMFLSPVWANSDTSLSTQTIVAVLDSGRIDLAEDVNKGLQYYHMSNPGDAQFVLKTVYSRDLDSCGALDEVCELLENGTSLLLDLSSPHVAPVVRSMAAYMSVPYVSVLDESYFSLVHCNSSLSVSAIPPATIMLKSIGDIVTHENLTNVAIIYDNSFDLQNVPRRVLTDIPTEHMYLRMAETDAELVKQVQRIKDLELANFFLVCNDTNAEKFLGQANRDGLADNKYSFFVLTKSSRVFCSNCRKKMNIIVISGNAQGSLEATNKYVEFMKTFNPKYSRYFVNVDKSFVFDLTVLLAEAFANLTKFTEFNYTNCYTADPPQLEAVEQTIQYNKAVREARRQGVFGTLASDGHVVKQDLTLSLRRQVFEKGETLSHTRIANWTEMNGLLVDSGSSITLQNVKRQYRVVTVPTSPPFVMKTLLSNGSYTYQGYCVDLLNKIAEKMGFDYVIFDSPDGLFGNMHANGTWNGVIRELIDKRADIAIGPLSVMAERENVIDFTVPYYDLVGITILMKKPAIEYTLFKFMTVLDGDVWGCSVAAFFIVSFLLFVFDKFSPYSYQNNKLTWTGEGPEPRVFSIKEGVWFCMMSLTPQGGGEAPRALSGRLLAATWWLFGFIMIAIYTANLAAFLTVSRLDTPIETLDDLAKQFKTKYAPMEGSGSQVYFQRMADIENRFYSIWKEMSLNDSLNAVERAKLAVWDYPVSDKFTNMWDSMKTSEFPKDIEDAKWRVKNEDFAYIGDATSNKYATLHDCDLWEVGEEFSRKPYALAVQEGSPLKNEISNVILQLLNQRYLEELKSRWWQHEKKNCPEVESETDGISINNIGGVFLVIVIGTGLGLLTLAVEVYLYKYRPSRQRKMPVTKSLDQVKTNNIRKMSLTIPDPKREESELKGMNKNNNMSSPKIMPRMSYGEDNRGFDEVSEKL